jgi:hypothetical protein
MGDGVLRVISCLYGIISVHFKEVCDSLVTKRRAAWYSNDYSDFTVAMDNADISIARRYYYP